MHGGLSLPVDDPPRRERRIADGIERVGNSARTRDGRLARYMTRIMVMSNTQPLANVKAKFSEMVDRVEHTQDRIIVTRNGRPAAVLISPDEFDSMRDTVAVSSDEAFMEEIRKGMKELKGKKARLFTLDELFR